jgi:hypothetical protein
MKYFIFVLLIFLPVLGYGQEGRGAVGLMLGNPTGLNGKYWQSDDRAIDAGLGFSVGKNSDFSLHSDYLFHQKDALYINDVHPLDLYFGLGGRMEFAGDIEIGVRLPVGVVREFSSYQADVFLEAAPIVDVLTKFGVEIHLLLGSRYYFE